ncbi:MAG: 50S ribosomal protein L10 [Minisyncoccia bacterium]
MAINKEKKSEILAKLKKIVKDSASVVFINFHSLPVSESSKIRRELRGKSVGYTVAKKTLIKKAFEDEKLSGSIPNLPGELGIVYGTDLLDPAREIYTFQKKLDKKVQIVGGVFEGKFMTLEEMTSVAQIPGLKTLQAQFVNLINSPIQRFAIALDAIARVKSSSQ